MNEEWGQLRGPRSRHHSLPRTSLNISSSHNLVMKHLPGADPELVLLSRNYQELEVRLWREGPQDSG